MKTIMKVLIILAITSSLLYASSESSPPPVPSQEDPEVLNEGPIHEGFAQPVDYDPQAGIVAAEQPPADIIENPSEERPASSDYVWIPGYWAWEANRKDYIWVSGCWRIPPANMSWVPGYWNKVSDGWQWVAGFWIPTSRESQVEYLPKPPDLKNTEPVTTATISGQIWVPPCYYWRGNQYVLRSGYWLTPYDNWVWIPSHYSWTPYGYVFVSGYWDYVLTTRGVLYAPVYFPKRYHRLVRNTYSLRVIVNVGNLRFNLFSYPRYCHYFFGDYYSDVYVSLGIYPWYEFRSRHTWYDPIYEYDRWHYRGTIPHWDDNIRREFDLRRTDVSLRPPRTYRELELKLTRATDLQRNEIRMVEPLRDQIAAKRTTLQFTRMNDREQQRIESHSNEVNNFRYERSQIENRLSVRSMDQSRTQENRTNIPGNPSVRMGTETRVSDAERTRRETESNIRTNALNRNSSERMDFPRSPITGRNSMETRNQPENNNSRSSNYNTENRTNRTDRTERQEDNNTSAYRGNGGGNGGGGRGGR